MTTVVPPPEIKYVTEIPSSLKQLARFVARAFYTQEDALIIDMLVRNPCMKEDDIGDLLHYDKKFMRARISTLKNDKFLQIRLKMETGPDGKAQKVNYYFINYRSFVNVIKYKLDHMRKRMETEERDATSRASFKCTSCEKTFTDLEADYLFDPTTLEFRCTFCGTLVEEDNTASAKKDTRLMLARFNEQMQPLYELLRECETIHLAPELYEPEPIDIDTIRGIKPMLQRPDGQQWSGEATRNSGFAVEETRVKISLDETATPQSIQRKDRPVWMSHSTLDSNMPNHLDDSVTIPKSSTSINSASSTNTKNKKESEDTMALLLLHESQSLQNGVSKHNLYKIRPDPDNSDSDDSDTNNAKMVEIQDNDSNDSNSDSFEDVVNSPMVNVAGCPHPITEITNELVAQMTRQEKAHYIHVYQQNFSFIYD